MWQKDRQEYYLKLTLAVYRVTGLLPEEELLRQQIRTSANQVLADLICFREAGSLSESIKTLDNILKQAQERGLLDARNFIVLRREYSKISSISLNTRKEKIKAMIQRKDRIKVGELVHVFPQISRRTLTRDLEDLHKDGSIVKAGDGRGASYSINRTLIRTQ